MVLLNLKTAMLMTVGISLLENVADRIHNEPSIRNIAGQNWKPLPSKNQIMSGQGINKYYPVAYPTFKEELQNNFQTLHNIQFPCAEVESFCYWLREVGKNLKGQVNLEKIILLPTEIDQVINCAGQVKTILEKDVLPSTLAQNARIGNPRIEQKETPQLLSPTDEAKEFAQKFTEDVAEFLQMIDKVIKDLRAGGFDRIIINITGGYKVLIAIFASFGFVRQDTDVEVIYKHEHAKFLAEVPPLPVAWDLKLFDEYRSLLKGRTSINFEPPPKLKVMFHQMGNEWERTPFAKVLQGIYENDRLRRFGTGARLMRWFQDTSFKKKLEEGIARWEHIWIGDQIPETVEHSRGHSARLLEYAADLLEPKFRTDRNFLSDGELYLLICCLWLHDIGHTGLEFKVPNTNTTIPIALFPSLVRRWHNFLSYDLIFSSDYLTDEEKGAVALLSKYDRGKLPLLKSEGKWQDEIFPQICVEPLENVIKNGMSFQNGRIPKEKALQLCAMLRVLDGCDLQSDRIIDKDYWTERRQRTKAEVDYLWDRLKKLWEFLDLCGNAYKSELERIEKTLMNVYKNWKDIPAKGGWENAQQVEDTIDKDIEPAVMCLIGATAGMQVNNTVCGKKYKLSEWKTLGSLQKEILLNLLSLIDRIAFKMSQEAHFLKHSRVKLVYITCQDGKYRFNMTFNEEIGSMTGDQKHALAKEVWKELTQGVKEVLKSAGIEFDGVFSEGKLLLSCEEGRQ